MRRSKVNRRRDRKIFSRTASRTKAKNLPGKIQNLGGNVL